MPAFTNFLKGVTRKSSKTIKKAAPKIEASAGRTMAKPVAVNTRTRMYAEGPGMKSALKEQAATIARSRTVKYAGTAAAGAVLIGGSVYVLGKGGKSGLSQLAYGVRDITGNQTPEDIRDYQLENYEKEIALDRDALKNIKDYADFLNATQQSDSPSTRDIYDRYFGGGNAITSPRISESSLGEKTLKAGALLAGLAIAVAGGVAIYKASKKKK